jgi:hypothetical protein
VSFLHRFGSSLNPHYHFNLCVVDGLFERIDSDPENPDPETKTGSLRFHQAIGRTPALLDRLQHTVRSRVLRHFRRHGLLEPHDADDMLTWDHGGGFSLDASVRIEANDPAGRTALRLSALEFLDRLANLLPPPRIHRHRYHGVFAPNAPLRPLISPLPLPPLQVGRLR